MYITIVKHLFPNPQIPESRGLGLTLKSHRPPPQKTRSMYSITTVEELYFFNVTLTLTVTAGIPEYPPPCVVKFYLLNVFSFRLFVCFR